MLKATVAPRNASRGFDSPHLCPNEVPWRRTGEAKVNLVLPLIQAAIKHIVERESSGSYYPKEEYNQIFGGEAIGTYVSGPHICACSHNAGASSLSFIQQCGCRVCECLARVSLFTIR
jgi:hypothetical protein